MRDSHNPMQDYTSVGSAEKLGFVGESPIAEQGKPLQVMDECKEFTKEDSEKITELLRNRMGPQSFISTEKSNDWLREYIDKP